MGSRACRIFSVVDAYRFLTVTLSIFVICCVLPGCFLAPAIDSFNKLGVTESDRMALLPQQVKKFQEAVYWGSSAQILAFTTDESRAAIAAQLRNRSEEERVVESKITDMQFRDDASAAQVHVRVKFFRVPYYVINDRIERQEWSFSVSGGWRIVSREILPSERV